MEPKGPAAEQTLRSAPSVASDAESDERFRTIFEHAPEAILVLDVDTGHFVEANQRVRELLGYTQEETRHLTAIDVSMEFQADGRPAAEAANQYISETVAGGKPSFHWLFKHMAGYPIEGEVRMTRMPPFEKHLVLARLDRASGPGFAPDLRESRGRCRFRSAARRPRWQVSNGELPG